MVEIGAQSTKMNEGETYQYVQPQPYVTKMADIVRTNSASNWMAAIEADHNQVKQALLAKLATVPASAAKVSGKRNDSDVSYLIWQKVKHKVGIDFEEPLTLSQWRQMGNFEKEFMPLAACTETQNQEALLLFDKKLRDKNRYSDILAFNHSRIHLVPRASITEGEPFVNGYINANFVDGPLGQVNDRKIIACQGPLENTHQDFWRMVAQENVTLIVTTCNVIENGRSKCHHFWPLDQADKATPEGQMFDEQWQDELEAVNISVQMTAPAVQLTDSLFLRKFTLTDNDLGITSREIRQLHYTGWPDHGVPTDSSLESFQRMFEIFTYMLLASDPNEKAIVHCSAGIGRTGTTIGLAHLIVSLFAQKNQGISDPKISVFSTIRRLREQRFHLVQMPGQYEFIHDFLKGYLTSINF